MTKRKIVKIKINGEEFDTVFDRKRVQRFPENKLVRHLVDSRQVDLNQLNIDYQEGKFSKREYMQFNRNLGYSVCGYCDLFPGLKIENPVWDESE